MDTAFSLLEKGINGEQVTIVAKYQLGDQSTNYTSPWAGCNFSCISPDDEQAIAYDKYTYININKIQRVLGANGRLDNAPSVEFWDFIPSEAKRKLIETYLKYYSYSKEKIIKE